MIAKEATHMSQAGTGPRLAVPEWLSRPRKLVLAGLAAIGAGLAFNWDWLMGAGAAPILL